MKTSEIIMALTHAIAVNRDANPELLIAAQNAMFRLYEFTHLDGVIKDPDIDQLSFVAPLWDMSFTACGYPEVTTDQKEVRRFVRDAIRKSIDLVDRRKEFTGDESNGNG